MYERMNDGTGLGLVEFCDWMGDKGLMNRTTARAYRISANVILGVRAGSGGSEDVRTLDVDEVLERFHRKNSGRYSPGSMDTYKARFRKAVEAYLRYLDDPANFKVAGARRSPRPARKPNDRSRPTLVSQEASPSAAEGQMPRPSNPLIQYPFPLLSGETAFLSLPKRFRTSEVKRLAAFIESLAIADEALNSTRTAD